MPSQAEIDDFLRRNPGDQHRLGTAFQSTNDRPFDSQSAFYDQGTNQLSSGGVAELQRRLGAGQPMSVPRRDVPQASLGMLLGMSQPATGAAYADVTGPSNIGELLQLRRRVAAPRV